MALTLDFADKHVLVFGGTTGISFGIAGTFAKHGAKVSVASRKQENVDTTVSSLAAAGGKVMGVVATCVISQRSAGRSKPPASSSEALMLLSPEPPANSSTLSMSCPRMVFVSSWTSI